ncbi:MAG: FmdB family zinc ribbon protein [Actinomycetota bacterium]
MPTYEYACVQCGNRIEIFHRIGDEPPRVCEVCGGDLRKVFHPAGIVFKGSGFYKTDSRQTSKAGKDSGSSEGSGEKKPERAGGGKGESKSDSGSSGKSEKKEAPS